MGSLDRMEAMLTKRPPSFPSLSDAIVWCLSSGMVQVRFPAHIQHQLARLHCSKLVFVGGTFPEPCLRQRFHAWRAALRIRRNHGGCFCCYATGGG